MFRAAMCPSSGELLYQCDTWFMSLCVDDHLVFRLPAYQTVIYIKKKITLLWDFVLVARWCSLSTVTCSCVSIMDINGCFRWVKDVFIFYVFYRHNRTPSFKWHRYNTVGVLYVSLCNEEIMQTVITVCKFNISARKMWQLFLLPLETFYPLCVHTLHTRLFSPRF